MLLALSGTGVCNCRRLIYKVYGCRNFGSAAAGCEGTPYSSTATPYKDRAVRQLMLLPQSCSCFCPEVLETSGWVLEHLGRGSPRGLQLKVMLGMLTQLSCESWSRLLVTSELMGSSLCHARVQKNRVLVKGLMQFTERDSLLGE